MTLKEAIDKAIKEGKIKYTFKKKRRRKKRNNINK